MTRMHCVRGHPWIPATIYEPPRHSPACWPCKLEARFRHLAARGEAYNPGPTAAALLEAYAALGIRVRTTWADEADA